MITHSFRPAIPETRRIDCQKTKDQHQHTISNSAASINNKSTIVRTVSNDNSSSNKAGKEAKSVGRKRMKEKIKETRNLESATMSDNNNNNNNNNKDNDDDEGQEELTTLGIPVAKNVGRKRMIDETKLSPDEARKLEIRRAYNRQSAAQARNRNKERIAHLQATIEQLTRENANFRSVIEQMSKQLEELVKQNRILVLQQGLLQKTTNNAAATQPTGAFGPQQASSFTGAGSAAAGLFAGGSIGLAGGGGGTFPSTSNHFGNGGLPLPAGAKAHHGNNRGAGGSSLSASDILKLLLEQQQQQQQRPSPPPAVAAGVNNRDLALFAAATGLLPFLQQQQQQQQQNSSSNGNMVVSGTNTTTGSTTASRSTPTNTSSGHGSSGSSDADGSSSDDRSSGNNNNQGSGCF